MCDFAVGSDAIDTSGVIVLEGLRPVLSAVKWIREIDGSISVNPAVVRSSECAVAIAFCDDLGAFAVWIDFPKFVFVVGTCLLYTSDAADE